MTTVIKPFLLLHGLLLCGQVVGASAATLETLLKTIAESEGRPVYEAFKAIPGVANTSEEKQKAFDGLSVYLGQTDKHCVVPDYYPPGTHVLHKSFSYSQMASEAIRDLGEPGRRGLVDCLTSQPQPVATQAAIILCEIEASAVSTPGRPASKNFPPLDVNARQALELFLQQHGNSFPVYTLTCFYSAGLPDAARYIHTILKTTQDPSEKHRAVIHLGSYGYEPALNDLLEIFKANTGLRSTVREKFPYFTDSDRVVRAITEVMDNTKDEALRKECQAALELVNLKAEWRRQNGTKMTNDSPPVPKTSSSSWAAPTTRCRCRVSDKRQLESTSCSTTSNPDNKLRASGN